jgi:hypothetical protein
MDGLMYGEGSYFTAAVSQRISEGEATDGVYDAGFEVRSGIRVPPYLSLQEKDRLVEQISEGKSNNFADESVPDPMIVLTESSDIHQRSYGRRNGRVHKNA